MFDRKKVIKRYKVVAYAMLVFAVLVLIKVVYISTVEREPCAATY